MRLARNPSVDLKKSNELGNLRKVYPELEYMVSGWQSVIVVLLKVGGGASLISTCTIQNIYRDYATVRNN